MGLMNTPTLSSTGISRAGTAPGPLGHPTIADVWVPPADAAYHCVIVDGGDLEPEDLARVRAILRDRPNDGVALGVGYEDVNGYVAAFATLAGYGAVEAVGYHLFRSRAVVLPRSAALEFAAYLRGAGLTQPDYGVALHDFLQLTRQRIIIPTLRPAHPSHTDIAVLKDFESCPFLLDGDTYSLHRTVADGLITWRHLHWTHELRRYELRPDTMRSVFDARTAALGPHAGADFESLRRYMFSLWLFGWCVSRTAPPPAPSGTVPRETDPSRVRAVFGGLAVAALKGTVLDESAVHDIREAAIDAALDGYRYGLEELRSCES